MHYIYYHYIKYLSDGKRVEVSKAVHACFFLFNCIGNGCGSQRFDGA